MFDDFPNRQTIRLSGYNYSQDGHYFVTICSHNSEEIFGEIKNGKMVLNDFGKIIETVLNSLPKRFPIKIDILQIMPNHIHLIIIIDRAQKIMDRAHYDAPLQQNNEQKRSLLSQIIGYFKMNSSKLIRNVGAIHESPDSIKKLPLKIFQRNYYEHIIRNEREYKQIVYYIRNNPLNWDTDKDNMKRANHDSPLQE